MPLALGEVVQFVEAHVAHQMAPRSSVQPPPWFHRSAPSRLQLHRIDRVCHLVHCGRPRVLRPTYPRRRDIARGRAPPRVASRRRPRSRPRTRRAARPSPRTAPPLSHGHPRDVGVSTCSTNCWPSTTWTTPTPYGSRPCSSDRRLRPAASPPRGASAALARPGSPNRADRRTVCAVARLIELTAGHEVDPADIAGAVLLDADLAILGADPGEYQHYVNGVRTEYAHVDDEMADRTGPGAAALPRTPRRSTSRPRCTRPGSSGRGPTSPQN